MNASFHNPSKLLLVFIMSPLDAKYSEADVLKEMLDKPCLM